MKYQLWGIWLLLFIMPVVISGELIKGTEYIFLLSVALMIIGSFINPN